MMRLAVMTTLFVQLASLHAQPLGSTWGTAGAEAEYYRIVDLPVPEELAIEAGSFDILPDGRLVIGTRRGEIYLVSGAFDRRPRLRFHRFASGLDEVFGVGYRDGAFFVTQQTEVTRISDLDGDGRADRFETLSDDWGFANYHEFSWGSRPDSSGDVWVVLGLSNSYHYRAPFRGWSFRVTPGGEAIPVASGIRSAGGVGPNEYGVMFYTESQGPWNGSCSLKHLKPGGFMGHPISFEAYQLAPGMGPKPVEPNSGSRLYIEKRRVKQLVPYAVVFPYRKMGQSISGFRADRTGGKFGPFEGQLFVADYSLSCLMRATTERINGVWQGACYPFREGLGTGILAVQFSPEGYLVTGGTNRGWPVRGSRQYALERLEWTGKTPFELERIRILPGGFEITFTLPVDREIASRPEVYQIINYTHVFQKHYGSPEVDLGTSRTRSVVVSDDGLKVELAIEPLVEGHVHEFDLSGMRSGAGAPLLHSTAYYTVNEIPGRDEEAGDGVALRVEAPSAAEIEEYELDAAFYKKCLRVQDILIATSERVSDLALLESAYQFDMVMNGIDPDVAQRIRDRKVLCLLIAHDEFTSDLPQFKSDRSGKELDFYNWRNRGFLSWKGGRPTVVFAEEDVLEYEGGMQLESILIHEFGHVIQGAGFDKALEERLTSAFEAARAEGLWNDGRAAQRFRRIKSEKPVSLLEALVRWFPAESPDLLKRCLDGGDILVNGKPIDSSVKVTGSDEVLIVFGGAKQCYAAKNRAEYWAEGLQCWYDTNRTMDHDHNHIHTRKQLQAYDPRLASLCRDVLGDGEWRFVSPRARAGEGHLRAFDPAKSPRVQDPPHIETAALDYYDKYWADYWERLRVKHGEAAE